MLRTFRILKRAYLFATSVTMILQPASRYAILHSLTRKSQTDVPISLEYTKERIDRGINWILYHQGLQSDNGITSMVMLSSSRPKIGSSYPEVTGYIIPTLFEYSRLFGSKEAFAAAVKASDFELSLQHSSGYFPGGVVGSEHRASVFNSGQIVHGLVRTYQETGDTKYLDSALRACRWICEAQDEDGAWGRLNYLGMKRVYDTKVCEALLQADEANGSTDFQETVDRNLRFALLNQQSNGWFSNCDNSYERNYAPLTHTIGYTIQGLLACHNLVGRDDLFRAATRTLDVLLHRFELAKKPLSGRFSSNWNPEVSSTCVTGDAQISLCWMDMYTITGNSRYINAALKMNDMLKGFQYRCAFKEIDGALPSSYPIWGDYLRYTVNSWGVKYYLDALMQEYKIKRDLIGKP